MMVKLSVFDKSMAVPVSLVAKVAPTGYDPRWYRRRVRRKAIVYPVVDNEAKPRDGYDPSDRS